MNYLLINGWQAHITFSASHIIPDYNLCGRLHGHTYAIHAKVYGPKGKESIIIDFGKLKAALKAVAEELDHKMLIPVRSKTVKVEGDHIKMTVGSKNYLFPIEDCALLDIGSSSAETLSEYVLEKVRKAVPKTIVKIEVGIDEGVGQGAWAVWEKK
ncbi:MAG: 6-pyruvoyl tetrahydropterin synthase [Thermoplasmata archaeon HGW-Thermoplasmata-2]|nr:MAG: 6-pyruvoyl tetrahydropterin synthase [Thermoplasmata archaeon HGW-Thermoplasmata-2]